MATALEKQKAENERLRKRAAQRRKERKRQQSAFMQEASGQLGEAVGATTTAIVDAKFAEEPGKMATFGDSNIPAAPVVGGIVALGSLMLVKDFPAGAAFVGRAGTQAAYLGLYHGVRSQMEDVFEE